MTSGRNLILWKPQGRAAQAAFQEPPASPPPPPQRSGDSSPSRRWAAGMRTAGIKGKPGISAAPAGPAAAPGQPRALGGCSAMQLLLPGSGNSSSPGLRQGSTQTLAVTPGYQAPCSSRRSPSCLFQQETDGAEGHDPAPRADSSQRMKVSIRVLECSCWRDGGTSQQPFASHFLLLLFLTRSEPNQTQFLFSWEKNHGIGSNSRENTNT